MTNHTIQSIIQTYSGYDSTAPQTNQRGDYPRESERERERERETERERERDGERERERRRTKVGERKRKRRVRRGGWRRVM